MLLLALVPKADYFVLQLFQHVTLLVIVPGHRERLRVLQVAPALGIRENLADHGTGARVIHQARIRRFLIHHAVLDHNHLICASRQHSYLRGSRLQFLW